MVKKIYLALVFCMLFAMLSVSASEISVRTETDIYTANDKIIANCIVRNSSPYTVAVNAAVYNADGVSVWSSGRNISAAPNSILNFRLLPIINENGKYSLRISADNAATEKFFVVNKRTQTDISLGICAHTYSEEELKYAADAGFSMLRTDCEWQGVERIKGVYSIDSSISELVDSTLKNGMQPLIILDYGNTLYCDTSKTLPYTDEQLNGFANYCRFIAENFKGKVKYFEVWNEPNAQIFNNENRTGADYAKVLKTAYLAVKSVNPDAFVVGGAVAGEADTFIKDMFSAGAASYMDAFSFHYYMYLDGAPDEYSPYLTDRINSVLEQVKDYSVPIWMTETGYSTVAADRLYTNEQQSAYIVRSLAMIKAIEKIDKVFLYTLKNTGTNPFYNEDNFGLLDYSGVPKSAYYTTKQFLSETADTKCFAKADKNGYGVYNFKNNKKDVFVLWAKGDNTYNVKIKSEAEKFNVSDSGNNVLLDISKENAHRMVKVYDYYGNAVDMENITIDYMPKYVVAENDLSAFNIETLNGNININGAAESKYVTLRTLCGENTVYIDQTQTDENGIYNFNFSLKDELNYLIYIYNGNSLYHTLNLSTAKIHLYKDGNEIYSLTGLKSGDKIIAKLTIDNLAEGCTLYAALVNENKLTAVTENTVFDTSNGKSQCTLEIICDGDAGSICFFLLDKQLSPHMNKTVYK